MPAPLDDTRGNTRRMDFLMSTDLFYKPENGVIFPRDSSTPFWDFLSIAARVVSDTRWKIAVTFLTRGFQD